MRRRRRSRPPARGRCSATSIPRRSASRPRPWAALTPRTKAVIAVHLFGNVAPIAEIEALGVPVVEDAAQAAGSTGPDGRPARWARRDLLVLPVQEPRGLRRRRRRSRPTTPPSPTASGRCASTAPDKVTYEHVGYNSRLDELQAAILRVQLPHLDGLGDGPARRRRAVRGGRARRDRHPARPTPGAAPAWHLYVVRHDAPTRSGGARRRRIDPAATTACPCIASRRWPRRRRRELPGTEEVARTHLALPIAAALTAIRSTRSSTRCARRLWPSFSPDRVRPQERLGRLADDGGDPNPPGRCQTS